MATMTSTGTTSMGSRDTLKYWIMGVIALFVAGLIFMAMRNNRDSAAPTDTSRPTETGTEMGTTPAGP